jgi:fibronectin-binding autotransporter adhesin
LNGLLGAATVGINSGSLILGGANRLNSGATVTLGGGTLESGANATTVIALLQLNSGVVSGSGLLTAGTYNLVSGLVPERLGGGVANVTGSVSLTGTTEATTLNINTGGVLTLGAADRIGNATVLDINAGELALAAFSDTVGTLTLRNGGLLSGTGTLSAATYALQGGVVTGSLGAGIATVTVGNTTLNGLLGAATVGINSGSLILAARTASTAEQR